MMIKFPGSAFEPRRNGRKRKKDEQFSEGVPHTTAQSLSRLLTRVAIEYAIFEYLVSVYVNDEVKDLACFSVQSKETQAGDHIEAI